MTESHRLEREADFHNQRFAEDQRATLGKYYEVAEGSQRFYRDQILRWVDAGSLVLDYGCGVGDMALHVAGGAQHVSAIDLSEVAISKAQERAAERGLSNRVSFRVMNAEQLEFPDRSFDVVYGTAILHHLDLSRAYAEISRVLKPGGRIVFWEPMGHNPLINAFRRQTPSMRTVDEHPLLVPDINLARQFFGSVDVTYFHFAEIGAAFVPKGSFRKVVGSALRAVDGLLLARASPVRNWAWICVLEATK